ncbi:hypothetical protein AB0910_21155 [Streptomyces sp. NPDC047002]|uniref:hypothetical protein n=1 Tax=Streptomyces sp. NPDC047002 TaxID=3155475 RepID=UPI003455F911
MIECPTWCSWHKGPADDAELIHVVEPPGLGLYTCKACREEHRLVAASEMPLQDWLDIQMGRARPPTRCDRCGGLIPHGQAEAVQVDGGSGADGSATVHRDGCPTRPRPPRSYSYSPYAGR